MAIRDTSRKPYIEDNDTKIKIGLDTPIRRGDEKDGFFASTSTTINLRPLLFSQMDDTLILKIQDEILDTFQFWLPFVQVHDIQINTHNEDSSINVNTVSISIIFVIDRDPNTLTSITLPFSNITGESGESSIGY